MAGNNTLIITKENFESEVKNSSVPVLIDFWATWCGPCRMIGPVIDELADEYKGKIKIGKVNVDEQPELAAMFKVMSIPTIILFKNDGEVSERTVGARSKPDLEDIISRNI